MLLCAALHQVSMDKHQNCLGQFFSQPNTWKKQHWTALLRTQLIFILLCLSYCVSLTNVPPEPCKAAGTWEGPESGDTQKDVFRQIWWAVRQKLLYLTSAKSSLKPSFLNHSIENTENQEDVKYAFLSFSLLKCLQGVLNCEVNMSQTFWPCWLLVHDEP